VTTASFASPTGVEPRAVRVFGEPEAGGHVVTGDHWVDVPLDHTTADGPRMLEYNVRFGDPECQVVLPRVSNDVATILAEAAAGDLRTMPEFSDDATVTVVCASEGYPTDPRVGDVISGVDDALALEGVDVYFAGVATNAVGELVTAGGRVLNVCGRGATVAEARDRAYAGVDRISFRGMTVRRDIAERAASAQQPREGTP